MASEGNKKNDGKGFLQAHGYGTARLQAVTGRIDWTRPDAMARAGAALSLYAGTLVELLKTGARARRRSPGAFIGELVRHGDAGELPLLALALRHAERDAPLAGVQPACRAQLDVAATGIASHWRLLRDGDLPAHRLPDIANIDNETLLVLLARQLAADTASADAGTTLRLLKFAVQRADAAGQPAALPRLLRLARKLLATGTHARIDYAAFRTLPPAARRALLFTPGLAEFFLDAEAQAAARPPSPDFDPAYRERALENLAQGSLDHVDVDTLFLGAGSNSAFRARIVAALAGGSGRLACSDDVRERLLAGATLPELCLVACAAGRSADDMQRALAHLQAMPRNGVLGAALHRFALIAYRDWLPAEIPPARLADNAFRADALGASVQAMTALLAGDDFHQPPVLLFRHLAAWLDACRSLPAMRPLRDAIATLEVAFATRGGRLASDIDGSDLHALYRAGEPGERLALALASALRNHNLARWEHGFFNRLADADPALALQIALPAPRTHEIGTLLHTGVAAALIKHLHGSQEDTP